VGSLRRERGRPTVRAAGAPVGAGSGVLGQHEQRTAEESQGELRQEPGEEDGEPEHRHGEGERVLRTGPPARGKPGTPQQQEGQPGQAGGVEGGALLQPLPGGRPEVPGQGDR
jgi:hypothetical protein